MTVQVIRVEGEEPLGPGFERFGVRCSGTFLQRVHNTYGYALLVGARRSGPKPETREAPGPCMMWPVLSLILSRWMVPPF
jgi:hypothetical protein